MDGLCMRTAWATFARVSVYICVYAVMSFSCERVLQCVACFACYACFASFACFVGFALVSFAWCCLICRPFVCSPLSFCFAFSLFSVPCRCLKAGEKAIGNDPRRPRNEAQTKIPPRGVQNAPRALGNRRWQALGTWRLVELGALLAHLEAVLGVPAAALGPLRLREPILGATL